MISAISCILYIKAFTKKNIHNNVKTLLDENCNDTTIILMLKFFTVILKSCYPFHLGKKRKKNANSIIYIGVQLVTTK